MTSTTRVVNPACLLNELEKGLMAFQIKGNISKANGEIGRYSEQAAHPLAQLEESGNLGTWFPPFFGQNSKKYKNNSKV